MKHFQLFLTLSLFSSMAFAQTWTGNVSTNWDTPGNWSSNAVPTATSDVTIPSTPSGAVFPVLATDVTIQGLHMNPGSQLNVNGKTITINAVAQYIEFYSATINNTAAGTDIVFNLNTGPNSYGMYLRGTTFTDDVIFNGSGTSSYFEADNNSPNQYNGNVTWNMSSTAFVSIGNGGKSIYTGNFTFTGTTTATRNFFAAGASIAGNLNISNGTGGDFSLGSLANQTLVSGQVNITIASNTNAFNLLNLKNLTTGGSIAATNTRGFNLQKDTLLLSSLSISNYKGNEYGYLYDSKITAPVNISDDASYTNGYATYIRNNQIIGNATYSVTGFNAFYEADAANSAVNYTGNTAYNVSSGVLLSIGSNAKNMYTGNVSINRTGNGPTRIFGQGVNISGNFSYNNNASGELTMGASAAQTLINGMLNIVKNDVTNTIFNVVNVKNLTNGGSIQASNTAGFTFDADTLLLTSLAINNYGGSQYGYLFNSRINANLTLSSAANYGGGYVTSINNNSIIGNTVFTVDGFNTFFESANANTGNTFTGNVTVNIPGQATVNLSAADTVSISGNLTISRTGSGTVNAFGAGGSIGGNLTYTKNNAHGDVNLGTTNSTTNISGTVSITNNDTLPSVFALRRLKNATGSGFVTATKTRGFLLERDTLTVSNISISNYYSTEYGYFLDNTITANVSIKDSSVYGGGYFTLARGNNITGNTSYNISGPNTFRDDDSPNTGNVYNGNVTYTANGPATFNISLSDTVNVTGNLSMVRNVAGPINFANAGGNIGGNFSYNSAVGGNFVAGNSNTTTSIAGTISIIKTDATPAEFIMTRFKNGTTGSSINAQNTQGFILDRDSLKVSSLSITGYRANQYGYFLSNNIEGDVTLADDASYTLGYFTTVYSNRITGNASFTKNGSNRFFDGSNANTGNTYLGNVTYTNNSPADFFVATGDTSCYGRNLTFNSSTANPISRNLIKFIANTNGVFTQTGSQPFIVPTVIMAKSGNASTSLGSPLTVSTILALDSGRLITTASAKLIIPAGVTYTGGSHKSFVQGPMDKIGNTAFSFPLGQDTAIAPIGITAPSNIADVFTAQYFHALAHNAGYDSSALAPGLDHISRTEYWILNRTVGTSNVSVTLSWDTIKRSGRVVNPAELRVSKWTGSIWTNEGNINTTGNSAAGTLTTATAISSFSPFTLASTTVQNTLPVSLISFSGAERDGVVHLQWVTEQEKDVSHYVVERSVDGLSYQSNQSVQAKNSSARFTYGANDFVSLAGTYFYRLKMVDLDGRFTYSNIVKLSISGKTRIVISPNPAQESISILGLDGDVFLQVIDANGKTMLTKRSSSQSATRVNIASLAKGIYILKITAKDRTELVQFIRQ